MLFFQMVLLLGYALCALAEQTGAAQAGHRPHRRCSPSASPRCPSFPTRPGSMPPWGSPRSPSWRCSPSPSDCPTFCSPPPARCCRPGMRAPTRPACPTASSRSPTSASMLALLSYPFLIEPNLASRTQGLVWSAGFRLLRRCSAASPPGELPPHSRRPRGRRHRGPQRRRAAAHLGGAPALARPRRLRVRPAAGRHHPSHPGRRRHSLPLDPARSPSTCSVSSSASNRRASTIAPSSFRC